MRNVRTEVAPRLLNPTSTAAVVLGAHDWSEAGLGRAPSFLRSARSIVRYLYESSGLGLDPELVLDLFDDTAGAGEQLARLRDTLDMQLRDRREGGRPVTDILVYYIGHGYTDDQGQLCLLVRRTRQRLPWAVHSPYSALAPGNTPRRDGYVLKSALGMGGFNSAVVFAPIG